MDCSCFCSLVVTTATQSSHQDTSIADMHLPILLYGSKTWTLLAEDSRRLQSFHMSCQRQILGVKCYDHIKNSAIAATTSLPNVNDIVAKRRLALFGHVVRLDANTPAHQILKQAVDVKSGHRPNAQWRRPPGRPRQLLLAAD